MSRQPREASQSNVYHITSRGSGKRILFEDDDDRSYYLTKLSDLSKRCDVDVYAWCLMDNHVHMVVECRKDRMSSMMRRLNTSYANRFNGRHGHVGAVFQGRFTSTPIIDDAHLLEAIRYVHLNPKDIGIANPLDYRWSSYASYVGNEHEASLCSKMRVLDIFGGKRGFIDFHDIGKDEVDLIEFVPNRPRISDAEALQIAVRLFGQAFSDTIAQAKQKDRDAFIGRLYRAGISIRQIERLTGIGSSAVYRAKERYSSAVARGKRMNQKSC